MRGRVDLDIKSWTPSHHPAPVEPGDGSYKSTFYQQHAMVTVFTFTGDERHGAFTTVEAYYNNEMHSARLPKWYHPRWHARIANHFDWMISRKRESRNG